MREVVTYVLGVVVCSGVFMALYSLLLERRVRFLLCRVYLPVAAVLAALIPAVKIPVWDGGTLYMDAQTTVGEGVLSAETAAAGGWSFTPQMLCIVVWLAGTAAMAWLLTAQLLRMRRLRKEAAEMRFDGLSIFRVDDDISSFSFFGSVFVSAATPSEDLPIIIAHERSHILHHHSVERVAMELMKAVLWWNPFVWIAARRLTEVQEYEADSDVLRNGCDIDCYINTLLKHLFGYSPDIANGLRNSLTKKRLKMMTMNRGGRYALLRMAAAVPVAGGLMMLFSFTAKAAKVVYRQAAEANPVVIVDGEVSSRATLDTLDSDNIRTITVIKNPEAASAYSHLKIVDGELSDGVIVVSTKDAAPSGALKDVLIVVDGEIFDGNMKDIDSDAIESIEILKDETARNRYPDNEKASNGVILIKMKRQEL